MLRQNVLVRLKIGDNHITASGVSNSLWTGSYGSQSYVNVTPLSPMYTGACILAEGLVHNDSLQQLHLGGNQIEDAGLIALGV